MDEDTKEALVETAERELGLGHKLTMAQFNSLLDIHCKYVDFRKQKHLGYPPDTIGIVYSDADLKNAETAIKKLKIALRDCGYVGELLIKQELASLNHATERIEELKKAKGNIGTGPDQLWMRYVLPQKGNPGNQRLREYIICMAGWYMFMLSLKPKKPGYGTGSIFPRLVTACLAVVDDDWDRKEPPYKAIKNALELLDKPPFADRFQEFWGFWHSDALTPWG